ncbi:MAG: alkaline phosphatase D family protein [Kiloniellales bacterium]
MAQLREPGLGPIVGHTTHNSCRIWIRAGDPEDAGAKLSSERRTIGVAAVTKEAGKDIPKAQRQVFYFRLHREYDRTGTLNLGVDPGIGESGKPRPLKPETDYEVRVGTLTLDDPFRSDRIVSSEQIEEFLPKADPAIWWPELEALREHRSVATFRTFSKTEPAKSGPLSFIIGSCRYPGLLWKIKEADQIFGPLLKEGRGQGPGSKRRPVEFVLMAGDQIYADMLNRHVPLGRADTYDEFQERYLTAFGSRNMRKLLSNVPTYMILDDHEIEDNWHQDRIEQAESRRIFNIAINAYMSYQWSHCPRTFLPWLYYLFDCGAYPFFVLDTRTQRFLDDIEDCLEDNCLLGRPSRGHDEPSQLERLVEWLKVCQKERGDLPKFIVTSSVFVPNPMKARTGRLGEPEFRVTDTRVIDAMNDCDSWPAFPNTRREILQTIIDHKVQNVVFLSGDIHCSNVAEMRFTRKKKDLGLKAFSITSSAFYWPFPFADGAPSNYVHDSTRKDERDSFLVSEDEVMDYKAWNFTQEDNYCRVDLDRKKATLTVCPYDYEGNPIRERGWWGKEGKVLETTLKLAPW